MNKKPNESWIRITNNTHPTKFLLTYITTINTKIHLADINLSSFFRHFLVRMNELFPERERKNNHVRLLATQDVFTWIKSKPHGKFWNSTVKSLKIKFSLPTNIFQTSPLSFWCPRDNCSLMPSRTGSYCQNGKLKIFPNGKNFPIR